MYDFNSPARRISKHEIECRRRDRALHPGSLGDRASEYRFAGPQRAPQQEEKRSAGCRANGIAPADHLALVENHDAVTSP